MKRSSAPRKTAALPDSIHHQLNMYAIAAGAAGVGVLTFTNLAEARIVYTPTRVSANNLYLDINNDGINDFVLLAPEYVGCNTRCGITWWSIYGSPLQEGQRQRGRHQEQLCRRFAPRRDIRRLGRRR